MYSKSTYGYEAKFYRHVHEKTWAFKRINYLLTGAKECIKLVAAYNIGNNDSCIQEALGLALEYNFVTDLTSLVIEENDDYIKEGPVQVNKNPKFVSLAADQGFVPISPITAQPAQLAQANYQLALSYQANYQTSTYRSD